MATVSDSAIAASKHYDAAYFKWQQELGRFGGWANVDKFRDTFPSDARVLDFGCGGGFLLANLKCGERFGVEPNPAARSVAHENGVLAFPNVSEALAALGSESIDVIVSDNALEHTLEPWRELSALRPLLKRGGILHIVVPCEGIGLKFRADDINQHVYSWSPQSLGNLLKAAGFEVIRSKPYIHKWPPMFRHVAKLGRLIFNATARLWGRLDRRWFQVEAVARRPMNE